MIGSITAKAAWVGRTASMVFGLALVVSLVIGALVGYDPASAQSTAAPGTTGSIVVVDSKGDGAKTGNCTLREAIAAADTNARVDGCKAGSATEQDAIRFALGKKAKTIVVGSQLPAITDPSGLRINAREASITISGNGQVRLFEVQADAQLALLNLTVADGFDGEYGGGLLNYGTVKVAKTTFSNNSSAYDGAGGGIHNHNGGNLTVINSTFSNNSADSTLANGSLDNGGGIYNNTAGNATVINSTFSNNSAYAGGSVFNSGTFTVKNSTFSENSAAGGGGGGIYNLSAFLTVKNSTFSKNSADGIGGGILTSSYGMLTVTNSTFSENSAGTGGGIFSLEYGTNTLRNTIVANSTSGGNCAGGFIDGGYNIDDGTTCGFSEQQDSLPSTDPLLADQPAFNGGPTRTIALLAGSPAINAIPEATNGCGTEVKTDQRGVTRPQGEGCDVGAFEKKVVRR